jgi:predicted membrane protein
MQLQLVLACDMTKLSVNLNKVALLRNARAVGIPRVLEAAQTCVQAGAHGVTVHPRPDERHKKAADVLRMALGPGMRLAVTGVALGLLAAFALTRLMKSLLFGVEATDPLTFTAVASLLTIVALLAWMIPARRATKVDPMVALRCD